MTLALLYTVLYALCGVCCSMLLFQKERLVLRLYFGLVLGLLLLTWLPSLFAFFIGFTLTAQTLAAVLAFLLASVCLFLTILRHGFASLRKGFLLRDLAFLWVVVPLFALGFALFYTHILLPTEDGVAVGQVTYGDLAMHLGFLSSIAEQGTFPPQYSIFPGHTVNYPFLCETSASSLVVLGASLRQAYLMTALYAYLLVLLGVWFFFREWLKTTRRTVIATILFFLGGGFGFAYFFDLAKHGASLNTLLDGYYSSNFSWLLDGFYDTPTNLPTIGLRWVNPIVDMLLPQRATLFGWAFLFPCLRLLHGFMFSNKRENILPLGLIAGALPLIHTHSFLALGILSAVWCLSDQLRHFEKRRLLGWLTYAVLAVVLAAPQLFGFAFRQASESAMVQPHWNWANEADSYLWFYVKNLGWLFLLTPIAFLTLSKRDRRVFWAPLVLWAIAEILVFQPNNYDNNKLLFVCFAFACGLVAKFLDAAFQKLLLWVRKRSGTSERSFALIVLAIVLDLLLLVSVAVIWVNGSTVRWYTVCTMLLLGGLATSLAIPLAIERTAAPYRIFGVLGTLCFAGLCGGLLLILWSGYTETVIALNEHAPLLGFFVLLLALIFLMLALPGCRKPKQFSRAMANVGLHITAYLLCLTMTLSAAMTILRELKSEYQVYTHADLEATEYIRENTEPDSVFLANSYLWNLVTPLTGRNIVTGTSTFLYFHGIDNTERERDVRAMYEAPAENEALFEKYGVDYVLLSNAEWYNYNPDADYFAENATLVFQNSAASVYQLH
ncbi:MAG: hypothetical protein IJP98_04755 [Clostridia bacterium]|nr:hypothetical protein [Clostridia bacterium]